jgi:hypothetical protein
VARSSPTSFVEYACVACGGRQTIQRQQGYKRARGHLKYLWCVRCRERVNHRQIPEETDDDDLTFNLCRW